MREASSKVASHWIEFGTWRTPIVVLNTKEIKNVPAGIEFQKPYQLIEGHTRMGWFRAFRNFPDDRYPYRLVA